MSFIIIFLSKHYLNNLSNDAFRRWSEREINTHWKISNFLLRKYPQEDNILTGLHNVRTNSIENVFRDKEPDLYTETETLLGLL